ncbi:MAG TPA: cytochrome P450, partial [Ilumatobacteraceae bacterium]|nr:cytochrome P450 [Ilumatobacteraceae bacterium]
MSVDETTTSPEPFEYVEPIFGDSPEGTHVWQRVPYNADDYGPVGDFATDFDHADPAYNPNAPAVWKQLRESGCPVAHSDRYGGMWVPITHDTVNEIAYDT